MIKIMAKRKKERSTDLLRVTSEGNKDPVSGWVEILRNRVK